MDKYNHIIEMGKSLDALPEEKKNDDLLVQGMLQSKVWLHAEKNGENVRFKADADAIIAKGIVAMLIDVFDNQPAKEVAAAADSILGRDWLERPSQPNQSERSDEHDQTNEILRLGFCRVIQKAIA